MTADVTREPTGGQGLREAVARAIYDERNQCHLIQEDWSMSHLAAYLDQADAVLALPEIAALIADREQYARQRAAEELRAAAARLPMVPKPWEANQILSQHAADLDGGGS